MSLDIEIYGAEPSVPLTQAAGEFVLHLAGEGPFTEGAQHVHVELYRTREGQAWHRPQDFSIQFWNRFAGMLLARVQNFETRAGLAEWHASITRDEIKKHGLYDGHRRSAAWAAETCAIVFEGQKRKEAECH